MFICKFPASFVSGVSRLTMFVDHEIVPIVRRSQVLRKLAKPQKRRAPIFPCIITSVISRSSSWWYYEVK